MPAITIEAQITPTVPGVRYETPFQGVIYGREGYYLLTAGTLSLVVTGYVVAGTGATIPSSPPTLDAPVLAGQATLTGMTPAPGASVAVTINNDTANVLTDTSMEDGTWLINVADLGITLAEGDVIEAVATDPVPGATPSAPVETIVEAVPAPIVTAPPVVTAPVAGDVGVLGTAVAGALVNLFVDGVAAGTPDALADVTGMWLIDGLTPLVADQSVTATATADGVVSAPSTPVLVTAPATMAASSKGDDTNADLGEGDYV